MTIKQKQCLLAYLGYYTASIDGLWGAQSEAATRAFQEDFDLTADGIFGAMTESRIKEVIATDKQPDIDWEKVQYFRREEFRCHCGGKYCGGFPVEMNRKLLSVADRVRAHFGAAALVSSGVRCKTHNANVGGVARSRHMEGKAMDFCIRGKTAEEVLAFAEAQPEIRYAYAIDSLYVHMDVE